ncbi:MAG: hypothetical protein JRH09_15465 [Deltaproteobacteria bacterium]|nr:hypothetical protein [Deltaproteobacteria bacterium]
METLPIVKRKDEQKYGEYRAKRVILECYDAMAEAMKTGRLYQTILDPPPADTRVAILIKGNFDCCQQQWQNGNTRIWKLQDQAL